MVKSVTKAICCYSIVYLQLTTLYLRTIQVHFIALKLGLENGTVVNVIQYYSPSIWLPFSNTQWKIHILLPAGSVI